MDRTKNVFNNTVQYNYQCQNPDCRTIAWYHIILKLGVEKGIKG
jgi:hypothetical protein